MSHENVYFFPQKVSPNILCISDKNNFFVSGKPTVTFQEHLALCRNSENLVSWRGNPEKMYYSFLAME